MSLIRSQQEVTWFSQRVSPCAQWAQMPNLFQHVPVVKTFTVMDSPQVSLCSNLLLTQKVGMCNIVVIVIALYKHFCQYLTSLIQYTQCEGLTRAERK